MKLSMMLSEQDIKIIVLSGEGYNAEFKITIPSKARELAGEVCAFANAAGGVILLGVNDDNEIKGVEISNSKRSSIQNSLAQLNPHLHSLFYFVEVDNKNEPISWSYAMAKTKTKHIVYY